MAVSSLHRSLRWVALGIVLAAAAVRADDPPQDPAPNQAGVQPPPAPPVSVESIQQQMRLNGGSLLQASLASQTDPSAANVNSVSFFAVPAPTPKTLKVHDLVTIIINEVSQITSSGDTTLSKSADFDAQLEAWIKLKPSSQELQSVISGGSTVPEMKGTMSRDFTGTGSVDRSDAITARITAEIFDVKPNGNLVLQALKTIKTDEEVQQFKLTGICRAQDVSADNTILSSQLYNLSLEKNHQGAIADTVKRGFFPRLLDIINPF